VISSRSHNGFRVLDVTTGMADRFAAGCDPIAHSFSSLNSLSNSLFVKLFSVLRTSPQIARTAWLWHRHLNVLTAPLKANAVAPLMNVMRQPVTGAPEGV